MKKRKLVVSSTGGGLDSFAMNVAAILERNERPGLVLFADTGSVKGDDGEWPETYQHIREVQMPFYQRHGIPFRWITTIGYPIRGEESLLAYFEKMRLMPTRISRLCTVAAKVERVEQFLLDHYPDRHYEVWIGFDATERKRAKKDPHSVKASKTGRLNRFPLIEWDMCRCRCAETLRTHGLPVPPKSACYFCPFASRGDFKLLAEKHPELFKRAARMEQNCQRSKKNNKVMRYGYEKGDGTDPTLREWIRSTYKRKKIACTVCGRPEREPKVAGCDWQEEDPWEMVS